MKFPIASTCYPTEITGILGIATRIQLYAQCILIVLISFIVRARRDSPVSVRFLWRLQFYTLCALSVASIYGRVRDQLGVFHAAAAYHFATLFIWSAIVGWKVQKPSDDIQTPWYPGGGPTSRHIARFLTEHMLVLGGGIINLGVGVVVILYSQCGNGTDDDNVVWKLWFGFTAIISADPFSKNGAFVGGFLVAPLLLFVIIPLMLNAVLPCVRPGSSIYSLFLPIIYILFWLEEVTAIEMSFKANAGKGKLVTTAENTWNFGQFVALVVLLPYLEIFLGQIFNINRGIVSALSPNKDNTPTERTVRPAV